MQFGLDIIRLVDELPRTTAGRAIARQLVRCGTSVGANYRAACRARSTADMIAKLAIVEEECDESAYWLEMIALANMLTRERVDPLHREANEILAMTVASRKTLKNA
jgi:four helix bundle protein